MAFRTVSFVCARFRGAANFRRVRFRDRTWFDGARFDGEAEFREAQFSGHVSFIKARFEDHARFDRARFGGFAGFTNARFRGEANFGGAVELVRPSGQDVLPPEAARRFKQCAFDGTEFQDRTVFTNRQFLDSTNFRGAVFYKAPEFHNCEMHQDTDFSDPHFFDTGASAVRAYRTLKLAMEQHRARNEEGMFYALEQKSLRKDPDTSWLVSTLSWMYEKTANYGRSVGRPLSWLLGTSSAFFLLYLGLAADCVSASPENVLAFTVEQIVRPFTIWTVGYEGRAYTFVSERLSILRWIASLQSIASLAFIALSLFALRWRFRRG